MELMKLKNKYTKLDFILGGLYYLILILFFINYFIYGIFSENLIIGFSFLLFVLCYNIIPCILILLPSLIEIKLNKKFYKSVIISFIITILYLIVIIPTIQLCIKSYYSTFTTKKWTNMIQSYRYLMIDDLEEKYNFVGMDKEDVFNILGREDVGHDLTIKYYVGDGESKVISYIVYLDENEIVIKTEIELVKYD